MANSKLKMLKDLRTGTPPHKLVHLSSLDTDVAVVILSSDKCLEIEEYTNEYLSGSPKKVNEATKNQVYNALLCQYAMRNPENLEEHMADSLKEVMEILDLEDINRVVLAYGELMMNKAPKLEFVTAEQLETIKKHLEVTPLSGLSTVLLVHLANCHQTIVSER